jgi:hypothetical protein
MQRWLGLITAALVAGCTTLPAAPAAASVEVSPPLIAGRVAVIEGEVRIWRTEEDGAGRWDAAELNDVVTAGTGLATESGRTEIRVGPHAFRLDGGSVGGFGALDFAAKQFSLERGVINLRLAPAQFGEVVTMQVADVRIEFAAPGSYRVDAIDAQPLVVTAFEGQARVSLGTRRVSAEAGQALLLTQSSLRFAAAASTPLDDWALALDQRAQQWAAAGPVSPYMTGVEELAAHGDWIGDATYGTVWVPRAVPVGWAPYRHGRWRWVAPWGWTWVDAAPWGYAPFHYGRWVVIGGRWCWWPGRAVAQPVWAPALVGFVGHGPGPGAVVAVGSAPLVGWYPLAPWHAYRPHFRSSPTYVTVINQTIIQRPPHGTPPDVNHRPGSTWVPTPRFREPIVKVHIPAQSAKVADPASLTPMAPPPRPQRTVAVGDGDVAPPTPARRPHVRDAQNLAQTTPKFAVTPQQPLPGAQLPLSQPAPIRRVEPRPLPPAPGQIPDRNAGDAPRPKPNLPQELVPPYQQLQRPFPAEPARTPPAAPPTVRQPAAVPPPPAPRSQAPAPASPPLAQRVPPAGAALRAAPVAETATPVAAAPSASPPPRPMPKSEAMATPGEARGTPSGAGASGLKPGRQEP